MSTFLTINHQFSRLNSRQSDQKFHSNNPTSRKRPLVVKCCKEKLTKESNYYELFGISVDSSPKEIKDAYRKLQKKYHPDIAGQKGHERTLMLNKAYKVLIRDELRKQYDATIGRSGVRVGISATATGSIWNGPLRPQALFVDENACIGCTECVHHACNTFMMDEAHGTARVKVQYGDDEGRIQTSVDSCPVNCIHWVDTEDLTVLEYLIQPQPKKGYGIYGQGWERPSNVFMAVKSFNKQTIQQQEKQRNYEEATANQETPAQAHARENAFIELNKGNFARIWSWMKKSMGI